MSRSHQQYFDPYQPDAQLNSQPTTTQYVHPGYAEQRGMLPGAPVQTAATLAPASISRNISDPGLSSSQSATHQAAQMNHQSSRRMSGPLTGMQGHVTGQYQGGHQQGLQGHVGDQYQVGHQHAIQGHVFGQHQGGTHHGGSQSSQANVSARAASHASGPPGFQSQSRSVVYPSHQIPGSVAGHMTGTVPSNPLLQRTIGPPPTGRTDLSTLSQASQMSAPPTGPPGTTAGLHSRPPPPPSHTTSQYSSSHTQPSMTAPPFSQQPVGLGRMSGPPTGHPPIAVSSAHFSSTGSQPVAPPTGPPVTGMSTTRVTPGVVRPGQRQYPSSAHQVGSSQMQPVGQQAVLRQQGSGVGPPPSGMGYPGE